VNLNGYRKKISNVRAKGDEKIANVKAKVDEKNS